MVKNILVLSFLTFSLLSCTNDDDDTGVESAVKKYPESFILTKDGVSKTTHITYNDAMQITGYVDDYSTISFVYENGRVVKVKEGNGIDPYTMRYTNGILSGLDHYSLSYPVSYNSQQNSYKIGDFTSFGLSGRDILYVSNTPENTETFSYDTSKKGPLYDLEGENLFMVTLFASFQYYYLSASSIKSITVSNDQESLTYSSQNTYDEDGFLKSMTLRSGSQELFKVEYNYMKK